MQVRLIDTERYEVLSYKGEQIQQGTILEEWKAEASSLKRALVEVIAKKLDIPAPPPQRTADVEAKGVLLPHEHPQYLAALPEHEHEYATKDHEHDWRHVHTDFVDVRKEMAEKALESDSAIRDLEGKLAVHRHTEKADAFHEHADVTANLNVLMGRLTAQEGHVHGEVLAHSHQDVIDVIAALRAEVDYIRTRLGEIEAAAQNGLRDALSGIREEIANVQPKGDFVTRDEFDALTKRKGEFVLLSTQEVAGKQRWILEEVK